MKRKAMATEISIPKGMGTTKQVQQKLSNDKQNKRTLRSIIVKANGEEGSKAILEDPFQYDNGLFIEPPYHLLTLCTLRENSTELQQCIDAMVVNIDGFGYRLIEKSNLDKNELEKLKGPIKEEKAKIKTFLENINFESNITALRKETTQDVEDCGNAFWELIPYIGNNGISTVERVVPHNVRLTKLDKESVVCDMKYYNEFTQKIETKKIRRRFRRYVNWVNGRYVFFKEWGDPRNISSIDGKVIPDSELSDRKGELANAMIQFKTKSNRTPYGIPRYIGNLFSIYGSRAADEINFITFQNNNIPSMMVLVSNGQLTDGSIKRIEDFIETKIRGSDNRSSFLILEAEPADEDQLHPGTMKMDIKDLTNAQKDDQLFQNYDKNNADKIRRCFRLPGIFVGRTDNLNKATAQEARKLAEEQIFSPIRDDFDRFMNKLLVNEFEMKYHTFKSNSANVTDDENLVKILSYSEKTGGVTPNLSRHILSDILNTELPMYDQNEIDFDPDIPLSLTIVDRAKNTAGNDQSGVLAPNQGQISKMIQDAFEDVTVKLAKSINKELGIPDDENIEEQH